VLVSPRSWIRSICRTGSELVGRADCLILDYRLHEAADFVSPSSETHYESFMPALCLSCALPVLLDSAGAKGREACRVPCLILD